MSTPSEVDDPPRERDDLNAPRSRLERIALFLVPLSVGVVFVAALALETASSGPDLQLLTPGGAAPGRTMAVRAFLLDPTPLEGAGVESVSRTIQLRLEDADGRALVRGRLAPSPPGTDAEGAESFFGMEGVISVPERAGDYVLVARTTLDDGTPARCQAPIRVRARPRTPEPRGFPMHPLQQWRLSPIETVGDGPPPSALELRVRGGRCLLGERCRALVWVGAPAAEIRIESVSGVGTATPAQPGGETAGIVAIDIPIDAPEAEVDVVALRSGVVVARRRVHLPVLLGGLDLDLLDVLPRVGAIRAARPVDGAFIVDAFRDRRWERTGSVADAPAELALPVGELDPGLWRIQVRTDPYGAGAAAVRHVAVRGGSETEAHVLAAIRDGLVSEGADDAFTASMPHAGIDARLQAEFALSLLDMDFIPQPLAMSGKAQSDSVLDDGRVRVRWMAGLSVLAVGLFVVGFMLRRGLVAAAEARALLAEAGDRGATSTRSVLAMTLTVVGIVSVVGFAFAAAAILLLARGG